MTRALAALTGALVLLSSCASPPRSATPKHDGAPACRYEVTVKSDRPTVLEVDARCAGHALRGFVASENAALGHLSEVRDPDGKHLERHADMFRFDEPTNRAAIHYEIDLESVAKDASAMDVALRTGRSLVAPVSTWLLRPEPTFADLAVHVEVHTPTHTGFTTGLRREGSGYSLFAHEISVATYAVFGDFTSRHFDLPVHAHSFQRKSAPRQAELEIVVLDGPLDASQDLLYRWVRDSARVVGQFWRGFPVEHALVVLLPIPNRHGVVFGKVLPESSPGVIVLVGEHTPRERLYGDWILVHELFHLGTPSFNGEGKWYDEGLATYYEPLIRARAGWRSEADVWKEFAHDMPQGLAAMGKGLENADDYADIYWGGGLFCLVADLELRKQSDGKRGLEDGLVGVLDAGGNASEVWPLGRTLSLADRTTGASVLARLAKSHATRGKKIDLDAMWRDLGVVMTGDQIELRDDAPLSRIRRQLVYGGDAKP